MNDIQNQDDLYLLVDEFYKKLLADNRINYIFTDVVKIKIEEHLPILVTFWSQMILGTGGYTDNLTDIHLKVDKLEHLTPEMFDVWIGYFNQTVDENFNGNNCIEIKKQAKNLSVILQIKIRQQNS
ncbi:MAG: group III truncated hemoglobin [Flavobacterium sp.]|nr:group III truncated hemoglobin [Flavobacterium sp.]